MTKREKLKLATEDGVPVTADGVPSTGLQPPIKLETPLQELLWRDHIQKAPWITKLDLVHAVMWVRMKSAYIEQPETFSASMVAQLNKVSDNLGLTPKAREKLKTRWRDWGEGGEESPLDNY